MKIRKQNDDDVTLEMSPLIDCVFLLLIFFLVTTMMKKMEKQIRVDVPDSSVTIEEHAEPQRVIINLGKNGVYYSATERLQDGRPDFRRIPNIDNFVADLSKRASAGNEVNVRLYADDDVEFQTVIDMIDKLQANHLDKIDVRMRDYRGSREYVPGSNSY